MSARKKSSSGRMWIRLTTGHLVTGVVTVPCQRDNPSSALREGLHELDLGMPVWLPRHQTDWNAFGLTRFTQEHFLEKVDFDRMEISYIAPEEERKAPKFTED